MNLSISSTEAVRNFSELLNNIKYRGDRYTVVRGGKPAAALVPVEQHHPVASLADLREILRQLPSLGGEDNSFAADVGAAVDIQPSLPGAQSWE